MRIIRTSGSIDEFRNQLSINTGRKYDSDNNIIFLSIGNVSNESEKKYELGDCIESPNRKNTYCLYARKQYKKVILNIAALRISLKQLISCKVLNFLFKNTFVKTTFIISKNCFNNEKDEDNFLCTLKEVYFDYTSPHVLDFNDDLCNVVVCDY